MKLVELFNNYPNEVERKAKFNAFGTPNYSFVSNKKAKIYIGAWRVKNNKNVKNVDSE